jgi:hypothetical protein
MPWSSNQANDSRVQWQPTGTANRATQPRAEAERRPLGHGGAQARARERP